jgi:dipeptidyl aminopeptidase/acylaminoacyl peptidase
MRGTGVLLLIATIGCDGVRLVAPTPSAGGLESGDAESSRGAAGSVAITDARAGDGMVAVYWTSGRPRPTDLFMEPLPSAPPVALTRLFVSDEGPEQGYRLVVERSDSGSDTTLVGPLTNGVTYYFRAAVYDSNDSCFSVSWPAMATPGPLIEPGLRVPAPQADEPLWLSNLSWAPDGKRLAVIRTPAGGGKPDLFLFERDTRRFQPVTSFSASGGSYRLMSVDWSPDGQSLAFAYTGSSTYSAIDYRIWRVGTDGSGMRPLSSGRVDGDAVWVTPGELAFTRGTYVPPGSSGGRNIPQVYRLRMGPPVVEMAVTSGDTLHKYQLSYSPGTDQIVFSGGASGRSLYVVPRGGGPASRLTDAWAQPFLGDIHPAWAPNARVVFFASNRSGHYEIWSLDVGSGKIRQVTRGLDAGVERFVPRPSPDGAWLAFLEIRRTDSSAELGSYHLVLQRLAP